MQLERLLSNTELPVNRHPDFLEASEKIFFSLVAYQTEFLTTVSVEFQILTFRLNAFRNNVAQCLEYKITFGMSEDIIYPLEIIDVEHGTMSYLISVQLDFMIIRQPI